MFKNIKMNSTRMTFIEMCYDEDGNPKRNSKGEIMYQETERIVRFNAYYNPKINREFK